jgi:hypothetical protein
MSEEIGKVKKKGIVASIRGRFEKITERDLYKGLAVILVIAALSTVDSYVYSVGASQGGDGFGFFAIAVIFVAPIVSWSVFTLVVHYVSILLGGKGERKRFFAMCGYAYLPIVVQEVLQVIVDLTNISTLAQSAATEQGLVGLLLNHFNLFKVLVLFLVAVAVMVNYNLSAKRAVVATLVPDVAVIILSILFSALNLGGGRVRIPLIGTLGRRLLRR